MKRVRTVVIGANGGVGRLLCGILVNHEAELICIDLESSHVLSDALYIEADAKALSVPAISAIQSAQCVLICLPESVALAALPTIVDNMAPGALWVDTLSIKSQICLELANRLSSCEAISINPMFAPSLGLEQRNIVVIPLAIGTLGKQFLSMLRSYGPILTYMSAEDHDRLTAAIQVATHAAIISFGAALINVSYNIESAMQIATPVHLAFLSFIARILTLNPEVYWDIQRNNPFAEDIRQKLIEAMTDLDRTVRSDNIEAFQTLIEDLRVLIEPKRDRLAFISSRLLSQIDLH
jgi:4-amino-4-deoxyprephenate dehydrogenase